MKAATDAISDEAADAWCELSSRYFVEPDVDARLFGVTASLALAACAINMSLTH